MAISNEEVAIRVTAKNTASPALKAVKRDVTDLEGATRSLGREGTSSFSALDRSSQGLQSSLERMSSRTLIGLGALTTAAVGWGLKTASSLEQSEIAFGTMLGSASQARTFMESLVDFAANTPFELAGVTTASQKLLAYGFTAEQILPTLTALGDASAGLGAGTAGLDSMTRAIGQMQAKGRVQTEELMQLQETGIPALQILAEGLGASVLDTQAAVTAGTVTSARAIPLLLSGMEQRFPGLMEKQSHTLGGIVSNFKDQLSMALADAVKPMLPDIEKELPVLAQQTADAIKELAPQLPALVDAMVDLAPALVDIAEGFASLVTHAAPVVETVSDLLGPKGIEVLFWAIVGGGMAVKLWNTAEAIGGIAKALRGLAAAEVAADAAGAGGGGVGGLGGLAGKGKWARAARGGVGAAGAAYFASQDRSVGSDLGLVGSAALAGSTFGPWGAAVGAAGAGAYVGYKRLEAAPSAQQKNLDQYLAMQGQTVGHNVATAGQTVGYNVKVDVHNPTSNVDVSQAVTTGIHNHIRDREARR